MLSNSVPYSTPDSSVYPIQYDCNAGALFPFNPNGPLECYSTTVAFLESTGGNSQGCSHNNERVDYSDYGGILLPAMPCSPKRAMEPLPTCFSFALPSGVEMKRPTGFRPMKADHISEYEATSTDGENAEWDNISISSESSNEPSNVEVDINNTTEPPQEIISMSTDMTYKPKNLPLLGLVPSPPILKLDTNQNVYTQLDDPDFASEKDLLTFIDNIIEGQQTEAISNNQQTEAFGNLILKKAFCKEQFVSNLCPPFFDYHEAFSKYPVWAINLDKVLSRETLLPENMPVFFQMQVRTLNHYPCFYQKRLATWRNRILRPDLSCHYFASDGLDLVYRKVEEFHKVYELCVQYARQLLLEDQIFLVELREDLDLDMRARRAVYAGSRNLLYFQMRVTANVTRAHTTLSELLSYLDWRETGANDYLGFEEKLYKYLCYNFVAAIERFGSLNIDFSNIYEFSSDILVLSSEEKQNRIDAARIKALLGSRFPYLYDQSHPWEWIPGMDYSETDIDPGTMASVAYLCDLALTELD